MSNFEPKCIAFWLKHNNNRLFVLFFYFLLRLSVLEEVQLCVTMANEDASGTNPDVRSHDGDESVRGAFASNEEESRVLDNMDALARQLRSQRGSSGNTGRVIGPSIVPLNSFELEI